jgi:hypothetical protein
LIDELLQLRKYFVLGDTGGEARHDNKQSIVALADVESRRDVRFENRLFDEVHAAMLCTACQKMLGSLKHDIPAQMREDNEVGNVSRCGHSDR